MGKIPKDNSCTYLSKITKCQKPFNYCGSRQDTLSRKKNLSLSILSKFAYFQNLFGYPFDTHTHPCTYIYITAISTHTHTDIYIYIYIYMHPAVNTYIKVIHCSFRHADKEINFILEKFPNKVLNRK